MSNSSNEKNISSNESNKKLKPYYPNILELCVISNAILKMTNVKETPIKTL